MLGLVGGRERQSVRRRVDLRLRNRATDPETRDRRVAPGVLGVHREDPCRASLGQVRRDLRVGVEQVCFGAEVRRDRIGQVRERQGPSNDRDGVARLQPCFAIVAPTIATLQEGGSVGRPRIVDPEQLRDRRLPVGFAQLCGAADADRQARRFVAHRAGLLVEPDGCVDVRSAREDPDAAGRVAEAEPDRTFLGEPTFDGGDLAAPADR